MQVNIPVPWILWLLMGQSLFNESTSKMSQVLQGVGPKTSYKWFVTWGPYTGEITPQLSPFIFNIFVRGPHVTNHLPSLKLTYPLKIGNRKFHLPTIHLQGRAVSFREGISLVFRGPPTAGMSWSWPNFPMLTVRARFLGNSAALKQGG